MLIIHLRNLQFYAYHGVFEEEKKLGAAFEVSVWVSHKEKTMPVLHINETIDYVSVYNVVKQNMEEPRPLLETVATTMAQDIFTAFAEVEELSITITKKQPPVAGFEGMVSVVFTKKRNGHE